MTGPSALVQQCIDCRNPITEGGAWRCDRCGDWLHDDCVLGCGLGTCAGGYCSICEPRHHCHLRRQGSTSSLSRWHSLASEEGVLLAALPGGTSLFGIPVPQLNGAVQAAAHSLLIDNLDITPDGFRHGGATRDYFYDAKPIADIEFRGRWRSGRSLRRYQKSGLCQRQRARLPAHVLQYSGTLALVIDATFDQVGSAFMGSDSMKGNLCICPALNSWIGEERALLRGNKK